MGSVWESVGIEKKWELRFSNAENRLQIGIVKDLIYMHARVNIIRLAMIYCYYYILSEMSCLINIFHLAVGW